MMKVVSGKKLSTGKRSFLDPMRKSEGITLKTLTIRNPLFKMALAVAVLGAADRPGGGNSTSC